MKAADHISLILGRDFSGVVSAVGVGIDATIGSGAVVYRHGEATGALPGRLVRGECKA